MIFFFFFFCFFILFFFFFFFFNDTATTEIYTLSLHDALPISSRRAGTGRRDPHAHEGDRPAHDAAGRLLRPSPGRNRLGARGGTVPGARGRRRAGRACRGPGLRFREEPGGESHPPTPSRGLSFARLPARGRRLAQGLRPAVFRCSRSGIQPGTPAGLARLPRRGGPRGSRDHPSPRRGRVGALPADAAGDRDTRGRGRSARRSGPLIETLSRRVA